MGTWIEINRKEDKMALSSVPKRPDTRIGRHYWNNQGVNVSVPINTALSTSIENRDWAGGILYCPSALEATTKIAFKVCNTQLGTYIPLYSQSGALVEIAVSISAVGAYALPEELFAAGWFQVWTETGGVNVTQTTARAFGLSMKG